MAEASGTRTNQLPPEGLNSLGEFIDRWWAVSIDCLELSHRTPIPVPKWRRPRVRRQTFLLQAVTAGLASRKRRNDREPI